MRVTVCELPHEPDALDRGWAALNAHVREHASDLVLLPEFAMVEAVWEHPRFDEARWSVAEALGDRALGRLPELPASYVVGTRPLRVKGRRLNQGYLWSAAGVQRLRSKYFLPEEPGSWEATWLDRGDRGFPVFHAGAVSFGLNICTELWALETYATYAALGVDLVLTPRATSAATKGKWLAAGIVAAVRSGSYSVSSNRVDSTGTCGGGGWIIDPAGEVLAMTSRDHPFVTRDVDVAAVVRSRDTYPRYVFSSTGSP